jgi:hypothetical protein
MDGGDLVCLARNTFGNVPCVLYLALQLLNTLTSSRQLTGPLAVAAVELAERHGESGAMVALGGEVKRSAGVCERDERSGDAVELVRQRKQVQRKLRDNLRWGILAFRTRRATESAERDGAKYTLEEHIPALYQKSVATLKLLPFAFQFLFLLVYPLAQLLRAEELDATFLRARSNCSAYEALQLLARERPLGGLKSTPAVGRLRRWRWRRE